MRQWVPDHPIVPNPYTILTQVPVNANWFTVLDLKDAFLCIPLHPDPQYLFAFEWTDPDTHNTSQLTWTTLPQGSRYSPHLFGNTLAKELTELQLVNGSLLEYGDDLLTSSPTREDSDKNTIHILNFLGG